MKFLNNKHSMSIFYIAILVIEITLEIVGSVLNNSTDLNSIFISIINGVATSMVLFAIINTINMPIATSLLIFTSNLLMILSGYLFYKADYLYIVDNLHNILIPIIALIINIRLCKKHNDNILKYTRDLIKIKLKYRVIIYSMMITVVMLIASNGVLKTINNSTFFNIYSSIVIILPLFYMVGILTTSNMTYEIAGFKILMEVITFIIMYQLSIIDAISILKLITEIIVLIAVYIKYEHIKAEGKTNEENL